MKFLQYVQNTRICTPHKNCICSLILIKKWLGTLGVSDTLAKKVCNELKLWEINPNFQTESIRTNFSNRNNPCYSYKFKPTQFVHSRKFKPNRFEPTFLTETARATRISSNQINPNSQTESNRINFSNRTLPKSIKHIKIAFVYLYLITNSGVFLGFRILWQKKSMQRTQNLRKLLARRFFYDVWSKISENFSVIRS